jgi:hypothetical protein
MDFMGAWGNSAQNPYRAKPKKAMPSQAMPKMPMKKMPMKPMMAPMQKPRTPKGKKLV